MKKKYRRIWSAVFMTLFVLAFCLGAGATAAEQASKLDTGENNAAAAESEAAASSQRALALMRAPRASNPGAYRFDLSEGAISIQPGTVSGLKVVYGAGTADDIPASQLITIFDSTGSVITTHGIRVEGGVTANLLLENVQIDRSATFGACAFEILGNSTVQLELAGQNSIASGAGRAGLEVTGGNVVTIGSAVTTGSLEAVGGKSVSSGTTGGGGAGIGGTRLSSTGTINIQGGSIVARSAASGWASGIGSGNNGTGTSGIIAITGGQVLATGDEGGAGIGGGWLSSGGTITIGGSAHVTAKGGTVTTNNDQFGAGPGIGTGSGGAVAATVIIKDQATVIATGGSSLGMSGGGAGIGGGGGDAPTGAPSQQCPGGSGGTITIQDDAKVTATGGTNAAGIGGGGQHLSVSDPSRDAAGDGGNITITGNATVDAVGDGAAAGIGGGGNGDGGQAGSGATVNISGGNITVEGGASSPGAIGSGQNSASVQGGGGTANFTGGNITIVGPAGTAVVTDTRPLITTITLPNGKVGVAYSQKFSVSGGNPPYSFSIMSGGLPQGLSMSAGGKISGTPTGAGSFRFTVKVTDGVTLGSTTRAFTLLIRGELQQEVTAPDNAAAADGSITTPSNVFLPITGAGYSFSPPVIEEVTGESLSGGRAKLSVKAKLGGSPLLYQWQIQSESGAWEDIFGANSSLYTARKLTAGQAYAFRCKVNGYGGGSAMSEELSILAQ